MEEAKAVLPVIDERVEYRGTSYLRQLTSEALRDLDIVVVVQDGAGAERLAVLVPYDQFIALQRAARPAA